ncbi:uncharacterized protein DUF1648 [Melghiribacillus thermohalophilus]|uniref:Uncharacterized protein DUF1648 n=1 Tax=Melghiribacillus thermohalophilus TaxID=1324956 RepID=A0A4R3MUB6_9BACI|nr:DUF1648 domain-containing protein [Melghiribacillus thermohalophilus]TCT19327.1 uncharacterized protein DUF1648 [Melghiribacillus thermohalophilus]
MTESWKRPKLQLPKTKSEWIGDIIGYSIYVGSILFLILVWNRLPDEVPGHYNALGEVDRWGSKWELLVLPGSGAFIALLMQILEKFPEVHNYPKRLNESNAKQFYLLSRKLMNQLKNVCLILFSLVLMESIFIALGKEIGFGIWFLPITIMGTGIPIILALIRQRNIQ